MSHERECLLIVSNLENLEGEIKDLRREVERRDDRLARLQSNLSQALNDAIDSGSSVGRRPSRGSRVGIALDIIGALGQVLGNDNSADIRRLEGEIAQIEGERQDLVGAINAKLDQVRDQQNEFSRFNCFDIGFSHEVLNIRCR